MQFLYSYNGTLSYKDGMKPVVADKFPCYKIYLKTNIYIIIIMIDR